MADLALGLMSGTSADGVSAALLRVHGGSAEVLAHRTYPYPAGLRTLKGSANSSPRATGARGRRILGKLVR